MPVDPASLDELAAKMRQLGLPDPEGAARRELETGAPILATESFLKWLTGRMVRPGNRAWIDGAIADPEDNPVLAPALRRLLDAGADPEDLTAVARVMQFRICDHVCTMLDQVSLPGDVPVQDFGVYHVGGGDSPPTDRPIARLNALHEKIGAWDPEEPE